MTLKVHRHFIKTARAISLPLHAAIVRAGRVSLPDPGRRSLAWFLARVITGQQLSTMAARSIWSRVENAVKTRKSAIPDFFRDRNTGVLRQCGLSNAKVKALIAIREAHERGVLSVRRLRKMTHLERSEHLQSIWGVGQWTADMTSIFYFGDPDVWPDGDLAVQKTFQLLTGKRSKAATLELANSFTPYRSFLAMYMWKVLDDPRQKDEKAVAKSSKRPV